LAALAGLGLLALAGFALLTARQALGCAAALLGCCSLPDPARGRPATTLFFSVVLVKQMDVGCQRLAVQATTGGIAHLATDPNRLARLLGAAEHSALLFLLLACHGAADVGGRVLLLRLGFVRLERRERQPGDNPHHGRKSDEFGKHAFSSKASHL
jgi:hypothetical protein